MRQRDTDQHEAYKRCDARKTAVLVVENDPAIRGMLRTMLDLEGYAVEAVAGATEALHELRVMSEPRVVLVNQLLPDVDGRTVLAAAATTATLRRHRYVLMSTCATCESCVDLVHAAGLLPKPFSVEQLLDVVEVAASQLSATPRATLPPALRSSMPIPSTRITVLSTLIAVTLATGVACFATIRATRSRCRSGL